MYLSFASAYKYYVTIGSRLKLYFITHFSSYRHREQLSHSLASQGIKFFTRIIGIWCKKNKKYNTMLKILGLINVTIIVAQSNR